MCNNLNFYFQLSKYKEWVDKKATEFEEIEQFELSIEWNVYDWQLSEYLWTNLEEHVMF